MADSLPAAPIDRLGCVGAVSIICNVLLLGWIYWQNIRHPEGELTNKSEWSVVAVFGGHLSTAGATKMTLVESPLKQDSHDIIGIPATEGGKTIWILSNPEGIPQLKLSSREPPGFISREEIQKISSSVRLGADVSTFLESLVRLRSGSPSRVTVKCLADSPGSVALVECPMRMSNLGQ